MNKILTRLTLASGIFSLVLAVNLSTAGADELVFTTSLSGANENPANGSAGTGTATVTLDLDAVTMRVQANFTGLTGNVTAAHIHCCIDAPGNVGVMSQTPNFADFPIGVTSGSYDKTFDMSLAASYNTPFIANNGGNVSGAFQALATGMSAGRAYLNIHTSSVGSGEIRGFLVPEPSSMILGLLGASLLGIVRRRRI